MQTFNPIAVMNTRSAEALLDALDAGTAGLTGLAASGHTLLVRAPDPRPGRFRPGQQARLKKTLAKSLVEGQRLLELCHRYGDVLAVRSAAPLTRTDAQTLLAAHRDAIATGLQDVSGLEQHQIQIFWPKDDAVKRFTAQSAETQTVNLHHLPKDPVRLADRLRAEFAARISAAASDVIELPVDQTAQMLLNTVSLTPRGRGHVLEAALEDIDRIWPEGFRIRLIGPAPAISFSCAQVRICDAPLQDQAARRLGLRATADASEIHAARQAALRKLHPDMSGKPGADLQATKDAAALLQDAARCRDRLMATGQTIPDRLPLLRVERDGQADTLQPPGQESAA